MKPGFPGILAKITWKKTLQQQPSRIFASKEFYIDTAEKGKRVYLRSTEMFAWNHYLTDTTSENALNCFRKWAWMFFLFFRLRVHRINLNDVHGILMSINKLNFLTNIKYIVYSRIFLMWHLTLIHRFRILHCKSLSILH